MKKPPRVALIGAGKFSDSPITRLQSLGEQLGPVKSPTLRVASRIANSLRAGHPVGDYQEFEHCRLILISVPDAILGAIVAELAAALPSCHEKAVIACSEKAGCESLMALGKLGAATGSLAMVPGFDGRWILLEGEKAVERQVRPLLMQLRVTTIRSFEKQRYLNALGGIGVHFVPYFIQAMEDLKSTGISSGEAGEMMERQVTLKMRHYFRSGKAG